MVVYDCTVGNVAHVANTAMFLYYFLWICVSPFIDASHFTQRWFPPREYGILIPAVLVSVVVVVSLTVASVHILLRTGQRVRETTVRTTGSPARASSRGHSRTSTASTDTSLTEDADGNRHVPAW